MAKNFYIFALVFLICSGVASAQEICNNGIDDDGDGLIDLNDTADCSCSGIIGNISVPSLIPNPSFEIENCCPNSYSELNCASGWIQASDATSDYMNTCDFVAGAAISAGLLPFPDGNGIVGTIFMEGWKEYVGSCLIAPMLAGTSYTLQMNIASTPIDDFGNECNNGIIDFGPVDIVVYGSTNCSNLPFFGSDCPTPADGWQVLGTANYSPITSWGTISISFTPSVNINAIIFGPPCVLPPDYPNTSNYICLPYFYFDNLLLNTTSSFSTLSISQSGSNCQNNIALSSHSDTLGGTWQWYNNGIAIGGETDSILNLSSNSGLYTALYTLGGDCETISDSVTVTIPPNLILTSQTNLRCYNDSSGSATVLANNGTGPYTYSWFPVGGNDSVATGLTAGFYTVVVQDLNNCTDTQTVTITQPAQLNMISVLQNVLCNGDSSGSIVVGPLGGTPPFSYTWSPPVSSGSSAINLIAGPYSVSINDSNNCIIDSAFSISEPSLLSAFISTSTNVSCYGGNNGSAAVNSAGGLPPYTYVWTPSVGNTSTADNLGTGSYLITITDSNNCSDSTSVFISEPSVLSLTATGSATVCSGMPHQISASALGGSPPYSYQWSNGSTDSVQIVIPLADTLFYSVVTDSSGCIAPAQMVSIQVYPSLNLNIAATGIVCIGDTTTISSIVTGGDGGPYTYSWNNGMITSGFISFPDVDTMYSLIVQDGCNYIAFDSVNLFVHPVPDVNFAPQLISGCAPLEVNFTDLSVSDSGSAYTWTFGDGNSSDDQQPTYTYQVPGMYSVSLHITSPFGCYNSKSLANIVDVFNMPIAGFSISDSVISILYPNVIFTNLSQDGFYYQWDFGDSRGNSADVNPAYTYSDTGTYMIRLVVENSNGCFDTIFGTLRVLEETSVFIPNAFTPNGDGTNDIFHAYGKGIRDYEMIIFDRWGSEIFHSTSIFKSWDGTYKNTYCENDVYIYKIIIHDPFGESKEYVGHVTLVR
jgi:gliding motility-associated-like protein